MDQAWESPTRRLPVGLVLLVAAAVVGGGLLVRLPPSGSAGSLEVAHEPLTASPPPAAPVAVPQHGWAPIPEPSAASRAPADAAIAGDRLVVWFSAGGNTGRGWAFEPARQSWAPISELPLRAATGRTATWTGRQVLLWGGRDSGRALSEGAAWDAFQDTWTTIPEAPIAGRWQHTAVWVDDEHGGLFVWGGRVPGGPLLDDGALWTPATGEWTILPPAPLSPRTRPVVIWTGTEVLVSGGFNRGELLRDGARYDPRTGRWRSMAELPVTYRGPPAAVWSGQELILWGRPERLDEFPGWSYDPETDTWAAMPRLLHQARGAPVATIDGDLLVVWGGREQFQRGLRRDGFVLHLPSGRWRQLPDAPFAPRENPLIGLTSAGLVLWGGTAHQVQLEDGGLHAVAPLAPG